MKSLDEYKKEIEKDPKARRKLAKLEKEFKEVEDSLTEEELIKYGLKPSEGPSDENRKAAADNAAADVLDILSRKI